MTTRILVIGGYGNFGSMIVRALSAEPNIQVIIASRSVVKAAALRRTLAAVNAPEAALLDIDQPRGPAFEKLAPGIVIHTSGPFQSQDTRVAEACIAYGCHYIDLADARAFVAGISALDDAARQRGVLVVSGASSVPTLTSAVLDHYLARFERLESLEYGISTAQKTARGLATTRAILSYTGRPFTALANGEWRDFFGWQDLRRRDFPGIGKRWLARCDIPDLALFPNRYPSLRTQSFRAGLELSILHLSLWLMSWMVRATGFRHLPNAAPALLKMSFAFDRLGSADSGFFMEMTGIGQDEAAKTITFDLTALGGDGNHIPCTPAILMAKKLTRGEIQQAGASACMGFVAMTEILDALQPLRITWRCDGV